MIDLLELKRLSDHHLQTDAFIGIGRIDADDDALGLPADTESGAPFHIRM
jgi:hypothetical protein